MPIHPKADSQEGHRNLERLVVAECKECCHPQAKRVSAATRLRSSRLRRSQFSQIWRFFSLFGRSPGPGVFYRHQ